MIKITVLGLWHQGVVAASCLSEWGYNVVGLDTDLGRITNLNQGKAPLYEPGLNELINQGISRGNLYFSSSFSECLHDSDVLLICYDTEVDENDSVLLEEIFSDFRNALPHLKDGVLIHVTAQVPVGTSRRLCQTILNERPSLRFHLAYSPENLRLGNAIELYRNPALPIIGCLEQNSFIKYANLYSPSNVQWFPCSLETAEMTKHGLNSFLATTISFANEFGNLCDMVGADGHLVAKFLKSEPRIGSKAMLSPGLGFAGGTLARDVQALRAIGQQNRYDTKFLNGLWESNKSQNNIIIRKIKECFNGSLSGVRVCILGLTYKPNTSTLRRSPSIEIIKKLVEDGAIVTASDPMADVKQLPEIENFTFNRQVSSAVGGVHAIILMTLWDDYKKMSPHSLVEIMSSNVIFDAVNAWQEHIDPSKEIRFFNIGGGGAQSRSKE